MAESSLESRCKDYAEGQGWIHRKVRYIARKNAPDTWFCRKGVWVIVEFKDLGEPLRPTQAREVKRLLDAGANVYRIDSFVQFKEIIDKHARKK